MKNFKKSQKGRVLRNSSISKKCENNENDSAKDPTNPELDLEEEDQARERERN